MANFSFNTTEVGNAVSNLGTAFENYKSIRAKVTSEVEELATYWQGQSYNNFKTSYANYDTELQNLDAKLQAFLDDLNQNNTNAKAMIQNIEDAMN